MHFTSFLERHLYLLLIIMQAILIQIHFYQYDNQEMFKDHLHLKVSVRQELADRIHTILYRQVGAERQEVENLVQIQNH